MDRALYDITHYNEIVSLEYCDIFHLMFTKLMRLYFPALPSYLASPRAQQIRHIKHSAMASASVQDVSTVSQPLNGNNKSQVITFI